MLESSNQGVYRFAACELDVSRRELRRGGKPVAIQPKVFELLVYLIENRERAVDKDEIQAAIWPRVIVTETSLTQAIRKLRRAVGDDSDRQSIIRTIHGHGYRFAAELIEPDGSGTTPALRSRIPGGEVVVASAPVAAAQRPRQSLVRRRALAVLAGCIIAGAAIAWFVATRTPGMVKSSIRVAVLPVENATGDAALDWTRLGLMSLASNRLASAGVRVVADGDVLRLSQVDQDDRTDDADAGDWLVDILRRAHGATHVLTVRLEKEGDALRLRYSLRDGRDRLEQAFVVGDDPLVLTRAVADVAVSRVAGRSSHPHPDAALSDDPFVNEAYARGRALALEGRCQDAQQVLQAAINQAPTLFDPRYESAVCARVLGEREQAERVLRQLAAEQPAPIRARARVLNELGVVLSRTGRLDEADRLFAEALPIARDLDDEDLLIDLFVNLAITAEDRSQYDKAREFIGRALSTAQEAGRELIPGRLHAEFANISFDAGALDEADRHYALAIESFRAVGDRRREAMMLNNQGLLRREQGRLEEAEALHRASGAIRAQIGDRQGVGRVQDMLALVYSDRGHFDDAIASATSALAIAREANDRFYEAVTLSHIAAARFGLRQFDAAERDYDESRRLFADLGDQMREMQARLRLGEIAIERGQIDSARAVATEVLTAARAARIDAAEIDARILLGDVALARGDRDEWQREYAAALDRARQLGQSGDATRAGIKLATAHVESGQVAQAEPLMGFLGNQPESYDLAKLRAVFAFARGDRAAAVSAMQRAHALAGQRWSAHDQDRLAAYRGTT